MQCFTFQGRSSSLKLMLSGNAIMKRLVFVPILGSLAFNRGALLYRRCQEACTSVFVHLQSDCNAFGRAGVPMLRWIQADHALGVSLLPFTALPVKYGFPDGQPFSRELGHPRMEIRVLMSLHPSLEEARADLFAR